VGVKDSRSVIHPTSCHLHNSHRTISYPTSRHLFNSYRTTPTNRIGVRQSSGSTTSTIQRQGLVRTLMEVGQRRERWMKIED